MTLLDLLCSLLRRVFQAGGVSVYGIVGDGYGVCGIVMGWKGVRMWVWWMCCLVGGEGWGLGVFVRRRREVLALCV